MFPSVALNMFFSQSSPLDFILSAHKIYFHISLGHGEIIHITHFMWVYLFYKLELLFSRLWCICLPRFFIPVFSRLKYETCILVYSLHFPFRAVLLFMDWSVPDLYFSVYSTLRFPSEVTCTTWRKSSNLESLNCAFGLPYIKITPLCTHRKWPRSQMNLFYLSFSHFWPCFWSAGAAWPILSLAIFAKMNFTRSPQTLRSTCIDRRGTRICLSLCERHTAIAPPPHNSFHLSAALPSSGCWQYAHCSPVSLNSLCACVYVCVC